MIRCSKSNFFFYRIKHHIVIPQRVDVKNLFTIYCTFNFDFYKLSSDIFEQTMKVFVLLENSVLILLRKRCEIIEL